MLKKKQQQKKIGKVRAWDQAIDYIGHTEQTFVCSGYDDKSTEAYCMV